MICYAGLPDHAKVVIGLFMPGIIGIPTWQYGVSIAYGAVYAISGEQEPMPRKPLSHSQRQRQQRDRQAEDIYAAKRQDTPAQALADRVRGSARWQRLRRMILAKHPLCADPYGVHAHRGEAIAATQLDHIELLVLHPELAYTPSNLQGLCTRCHGRKSGEERRD